MVPGLFIEKGWVHESIDYSFTPPPEEKPAEPEMEEDEDEEDVEAAAALDSQGTVCIFLIEIEFERLPKIILNFRCSI